MTDIDKIAKDLSNLSVMEAADLAKLLEEKWGVSAAAPVAVAEAPAAGGGGEAVQEKDSFTVVLAAVGGQKISVIKEVRSITGLGLTEAKNMVEGAPHDIKTDVPAATANEYKTKLEAAGATVELK